MVVSDANIHNIMGGMESTTGVRLHNHRRKLKQRFDIIKKLGQGTYGKVQLGINKETGQEVAIKTIKKAKIETEADLIRIRREIQIMSSVQHPNIIHIYEVFENREKMVLVMEYAAGGELYDYLSERKVLAEEEARRIFRQIATAVYYCHKHKICHRDLKLENILLDEHGSAKIADFGLSNVFDEQRLLNTFCGSPLYASPEIVKGTPYHGPEVDCWSLGVLLYTLVYGAMPFDGSNFKRLVKQISQGDYFEPKKPSPASPLIREMLTVNPARRADIEKICAHWWVNEGHAESCLDIAEELANQTPVRLDLLLSLAPPPPGVGSEKLLLTSEEGGGAVGAAAAETVAPVRCHSVGSLMDLDQPAAERKIREFERERESGGAADILPPVKDAPKRKLEEGISTEDAARGGAKKKERNRRQSSEHSLDRKAAARSSKPAENDTRQTAPSEVEMMDVDVDVSVTIPLPADAETSVQQVPESVKKVPSVSDNVVAEEDKTPEAEKMPEKESSNITVTAGKTNRKSVKKKSKPPTEGPPVNSESISKKESSEEIVAANEENSTKTPEEKSVSAVEVNGEISKVSDVGETIESVKPKLKKKKKVLNTSKSEVPSEQLPNGQEVLEQSSQTTAENKLDSASVNSSQSVKSEETRTEPVSDISDANSKNSTETNEVKTAETAKNSGLKTKKSRGELSLGKLSTDKTSDEPSPLSKPTERRRSKIFESADKFNVFLAGSSTEVKSPTSEKPKKVFIPGVKVSDFKQAFERRSSLSGPAASTERRSSLSSASQSSLVKPPAAKKLAEQSSKTVPKGDGTNNDTAAVGKPEVVTESVPQTTKQEEQPSESEAAAVQKDVNENISSSEAPATAESDSELKLVPALQVTDKAFQQEKAKIKKLKDAVEVISNAIAEETKRETGKKVSSAKPPVPSERTKPKSGSSSSSPKSPPLSPTEVTGAKKSSSGTKVTPEGAASQTTKFPFDEAKTVSEEAASQPEHEDTKQIAQETPSSAEPVSVEAPAPEKKKSAKVEITLKSATLPRRKTSKAEIQLGYPPQTQPQPVTRAADKGSPGEYRTEVEQMVGSTIPQRMQTQRSEVAFPVAAATTTAPLSKASMEPEATTASKQKPREHIIPIIVEREPNVCNARSASMEPESNKSKPKEHIIPIKVEKEPEETLVQNPPQPTPPKPPVPPLQQRSMSQRSSSLSRQSTQDSDTDSTISAGPEPIRKSPREYIIPIAVEGGGYVTPRASSLEPSESTTTESTRKSRRSSGRLSRPRRMSSLLSDSGASEDEGFNSLSSPFGTLHRHSSLGRDGENPDDDMPFRHMHKLRSSRPKQATLEHNDSFSSAEEEDDDDDGFEILTAESLFSTLLSRVRSLTQRLNVEDGGRPGFPSSRLLGHLGSPSSGFWSSSREPISRRVSEGSRFSHSSFGHDGESGSSTPWRRSQTREPSECESTYSEAGNSTNEGTLPRGSSRSERGSFSEDAGSDISSCTSHYTPSLARRLQHHRHASSEDVRDQDDDWSLTSPVRKSSLGMLPTYRTTVTQSTNSPSRRLSRTLSMRTSADTRGRDYYSSASIGADRRRISELSSPSSYSSGLLGTQESIKRDYLPPTRRSLHMLDSRNSSSIPKYKGSSVSDSGDYSYRSRVTDYDRVLPPLPYSTSSRKDSLRSLYSRQRSLDSSASSYSGSRHVYSRIQEEALERPHHSSSVPLVGSTESKASHLHSRKDDYKTETSSNLNQNTSTSDKCESEDTSTSSKDKSDVSKTNATQEQPLSTSAKKSRQIPSLLRLRSSSASREVSRENKDSKGSEGKLPRSSSMSNSTPDRSVLGKFLRQSSESKEVPTQENEEGKKKVRRISRFLRPDFYDTPREESIYAKEQDAKKAAEAEAKLKRRKSLKKTESNSSQIQAADNNNTTVLVPSNPEPSAVKDAAQSSSKKHKEKDNETKETKPANNKKNSSVPEARKESNSPAFEKQCSTSPTKSGFLHSLEKKLTKFKSSGDDIPVVTSSGKSRIDKAIHSLREKSLTPRGSDIITTESHLLKRAVSVDDCSTADGAASSTNAGTKLGNRVTSVLGLFRKYEDAPTKSTQASPPRTSVLSRLRRTQSVYAGSQSDSILTGNENATSQKKPTQDSQNLKKTHSNSSLGKKNVNRNSNQNDASKQKIPTLNTKSKSSPEKSVKISNKLEENINKNTVAIHPIVKTKEITSNTVLEENINKNTGSIHPIVKTKENTSNTVLEENINKNTVSIHPIVKTKENTSNTVLEENINKNTVSIHPIVKAKENNSNTTDPVVKDVANPPALLVNDPQATVVANYNCNDNVTNATSQPTVNVLSDLPKTFNEEQVVESINRLSKQENQLQESHIANKSNTAEGTGTNRIITSSSAAANKNIKGLTAEGNLNNEVLPLRNLQVVPPDVVLPNDVSPTDELESLDSWSVCSDFDCHDFPMSPFLPSGDETESVGDRIRRKSFYTRFNDIKKKHRKPSLTSLGTLSSSYREPNSFYTKKRHHSSELALQNSNLKPHRSKSLSTNNGYGVLPERKSPILQKGGENATPLMNGCDDLVNGSLAEEHCSKSDDFHTNGGSGERLLLPRHFNSNVNLSYNVPSKQNFLRRASDTRLSRSTESNIGSGFPKSRLPTPVNRVSKACTTSDNDSQLGSSKLDTSPLHDKYKRCNLENASDPQLPTHENQDSSAVVCEQVSPH